MLFKLSNLNSNLALTPGYLNPALNNSALVSKPCRTWLVALNKPVRDVIVVDIGIHR